MLSFMPRMRRVSAFMTSSANVGRRCTSVKNPSRVIGVKTASSTAMALAERVELAPRAEVALDGEDQAVVALGAGPREPLRVVAPLRQHPVVHVGMLAHVERR